MPYRIDLRRAHEDALDLLIELGALDIDVSHDGAVAAVMPDSVAPDQVASALGAACIAVSTATPRDAGSVWVLEPRAVRIGRLTIVPADGEADADALRLIDSAAFGTGLHPTTALCIEAIDEIVQAGPPAALLDVGTGSGILAMAALKMGVPRALGIDIEAEALRVARDNARLNGLDDRLELAHGGPAILAGTWPLIVANVLAGPLIEMAPALVRRLGRQGQIVVSGIPASVEQDVDRAYRRLGLRHLRVKARAGWVALVLQASW